jgi:hypothetical protein
VRAAAPCLPFDPPRCSRAAPGTGHPALAPRLDGPCLQQPRCRVGAGALSYQYPPPLALHLAGVRRNLLLRFKDDSLDESARLNALLMEARAQGLDVDMRSLEGGHIRPLQQALVDLPPPVARAANQAVAASGNLLGGWH